MTGAFTALAAPGSATLAFPTTRNGWLVANQLTRVCCSVRPMEARTGARSNFRLCRQTMSCSTSVGHGSSTPTTACSRPRSRTRLLSRTTTSYTRPPMAARFGRRQSPRLLPDASFNADGTLNASFGSAKSWYILAGNQLYVTRNAGQLWASSIPKAAWSHGPFQLDAIHFVNAATGWADLIYNSCGGLPAVRRDRGAP